MIDFFHNKYNKTFTIKNTFLIKLKLPQLMRLMISQVANALIPFVLRVSGKRGFNKGQKTTDIVLSLTSFPRRISKVHLVIESIFRQTIRPRKIILWLSKEQFSGLQDVPNQLLECQRGGLEIRFTEGDLRSYKKYYFLLKENFDQDFIIIDDDIFYPSNLIENIIKSKNQFPNTICANRCALIDMEKPYSGWKILKGPKIEKRFDLLPTGCGGVYYPAGSLNRDVLNRELFMELSFDADDLWLNCMAFLNKTKVSYTGGCEYYIGIQSYNNEHLHNKNVGKSNNDYRISLIRDYYVKERGIDLFNRTKID